MEMVQVCWIILFIAMIVVEIFTMGLTTVWFAGGAVVAFVLALLGFSLPVQIIVFLVVSTVLLLLTRPVAMKYFNKDRAKTNVESMPGRKGIVLEKIDDIKGTGKVRVGGMEWTARAKVEGQIFAEGEVVKVESVEGVKLIVTKSEEKEGV